MPIESDSLRPLLLISNSVAAALIWARLFNYEWMLAFMVGCVLIAILIGATAWTSQFKSRLATQFTIRNLLVATLCAALLMAALQHFGSQMLPVLFVVTTVLAVVVSAVAVFVGFVLCVQWALARNWRLGIALLVLVAAFVVLNLN